MLSSQPLFSKNQKPYDLDDEKHEAPSSEEIIIDNTALFAGLNEKTSNPLTLEPYHKIKQYQTLIHKRVTAFSSKNIALISHKYAFFHAATLDYLIDRLTKHYENGESELVKSTLAVRPDLQNFLPNLLLKNILNGNEEVVKKMIKAFPALLLKKDYAVAPSGHKAYGTPYQLALAVEDTQMAEIIKAQLILMTNEKEANAQYSEQFPEGWKIYEEQKWAPIFARLEVLTHAIRDALPSDITNPAYHNNLTVREGSDVATALAQFQSLLDESLHETITTGRHFNPHLLLHALKIYHDHYQDYFGNNYYNPKAMLFWQRVIGYIERFMPANYAQAFCDGLSYTNEIIIKGYPQKRPLKFYISYPGREIDFYPLEHSRLGFDFAMDRWISCSAEVISDAGAWLTWHEFSKLISFKKRKLTELIQHHDDRPTTSRSCCVVM